MYSIKVFETYQVAQSYPLFTPSSVMGAIAYALAEYSLCKPGRLLENDECYRMTRDYIAKARDSASAIIKNPVVLRRNRGVLEDKKLPSSRNEFTKSSDALLREYVFSIEHSILVIPKGDDKIPILMKALWLISRIGDTESLVSVSNVETLDARPCNSNSVNVIVKSNVVSGGSYTLIRASDEDHRSTFLAFPIVPRGNVYDVGSITVKNHVYCAGDLRFPAGDDW